MKLVFMVLFTFVSMSCSVAPTLDVKILNSGNVLAVFAHPDDETWVSGTLATLAKKGLTVIPVYVTSGDKGSDYSGANLSGQQLAIAREKEAILATQHLGMAQPIFFRFSDGKVDNNVSLVSKKLKTLIDELNPQVLFTFERQGITANRDHIAVSEIAHLVASNKVINFAVSNKRAELFEQYATKHGVPYKIKKPRDDKLLSQIYVSEASSNRINAFKQYKTQFPPQLMAAFYEFVNNNQVEELIINKKSNQVLKFVEYHFNIKINE